MHNLLSLILPWVNDQDRILDLGCGDGWLLEELQKLRDINCYGLEIDQPNILACLERGVDVLSWDLDKHLETISSQSYDLIISTQAIQALRQPDKVLEEMCRIAKEVIVSFPNFSHWHNSMQLVFRRRMPENKNLPYAWFATPNIHFCSVGDFEDLCASLGIQILNKNFLNQDYKPGLMSQMLPAYCSLYGIYRVTK